MWAHLCPNEHGDKILHILRRKSGYLWKCTAKVSLLWCLLPIFLVESTGVGTGRDTSVSEVSATQGWLPELRLPSNHAKARCEGIRVWSQNCEGIHVWFQHCAGIHVWSQHWEEGDRWMSGAYSPASLAESLSPRLSERPCLKDYCGSARKTTQQLWALAAS